MLAERAEELIPKDFKVQLEELKHVDTTRRVMGATRHGYELGPTLSPKAIKDFEKFHGIHLPQEYREHLLKVGNGNPYTRLERGPREGPGPGHGLYPLEDLHILPTTHLPFPFSPEESPVEEELFDDWVEFPGTLEIATQGCAHRFLLVLVGPHAGSIWEHCDGAPLSYVSSSFYAWIVEWADFALRQAYQCRLELPVMNTRSQLLGSFKHTLRRWIFPSSTQ